MINLILILSFRWPKNYPQIYWQRGKKHTNAGSRLFGPYPNSQAVLIVCYYCKKSFKYVNVMQSTFKHRDRPCMQYQIKRCRAPCVGLVSAEVINTMCKIPYVF
jgi:excinuclease ABC subunit C